jgi:hypothetical protein
MDTGMVFIKTDKGHEEIDKRTQHINFKHRTALIQVDGESTVEALLGKIPGDGVALLEDLLRDGFIATADGIGTVGTGSGTAESLAKPPTEAASSDPADFDLETAKHDAVRFVESVLGPGGESLAISIEGCKSQTEFTRHAQRTRDINSQVGGQRKAAEFWAKTGLPG